jgi:hypothetical protein
MVPVGKNERGLAGQKTALSTKLSGFAARSDTSKYAIGVIPH